MAWRDVVIVTLLTLLVVAGWILLQTSDPSDTRTAGARLPALSDADALHELLTDPDLDPRIVAALESLQRQLAAGRVEQQKLSRQLAELQVAMYSVNELTEPATTAADAATETQADESSPQFGPSGRGRVTRERLIAAGFAPHQAEDILSRADEIAMERLQLQYQAQREGWLRSRDYVEAMREIPSIRQALTEEYGERAYDRYLYASGRPNRLVVNDVFRNSPAAGAGLQNGDRIIALAGERIYSERDLRQVATRGSAGESVPVIVERAGSQFEVYLPRGPLGIRTGRDYQPPDP